MLIWRDEGEITPGAKGESQREGGQDPFGNEKQGLKRKGGVVGETGWPTWGVTHVG